jgi:hypothetical protein
VAGSARASPDRPRRRGVAPAGRVHEGDHVARFVGELGLKLQEMEQLVGMLRLVDGAAA